MNATPRAARPTREETRARILEKADELFRQYGIGKTTMADIAAELAMSPANVYKFFPSKDAISEACAEKNFDQIFQSVWRVVRGSGSAADRLERVIVAVVEFHNELFRNERQIFRLIIQTMEEEWPCIDRYDTEMNQVLTRLVQDGIASGEFRVDDLAATTRTLFDSLSISLYPHLQVRWNRSESDARVRAQVRFVVRALR